MGGLRLAVLLAAVWAVAALGCLYRNVQGYGRRTLYARPAGDPGRGVRYAFLQGMAPWAKESVRLNLPSYAAGLAFHAGLFAGFALLLAALCGLRPQGAARAAAGILTLAGGAGGLALLARRLRLASMRGLSSPDDYLSSLLCCGFVLLACGWTRTAALEPAWLAVAALLLAYVPLGKIRHCLFFFITRYQFGAFFGRRGTFPPGGSAHA